MNREIVFDLDGTLLSCRPRQMAALRAVSGIAGAVLDTIWQAKREGATTLGALRQVGLSDATADNISRRWGRVIETPYFLAYDRLLTGAVEALELCKSQGLDTVVLTARHSLRGFLLQANALKLYSMAQKIIVVEPRKGVESKAAELRRLSPLALIGDSEVDGWAAAAASVPFFAVSSGQRSSGFLSREFNLRPFEGVLLATQSAISGLVNQKKPLHARATK